MPKAKDKPIEKVEWIDYFIAQAHLVNDLTGREYEPGDTVTSRDFSRDVLENWVEIGVLVRKDKA